MIHIVSVKYSTSAAEWMNVLISPTKLISITVCGKELFTENCSLHSLQLTISDFPQCKYLK